MFICIGDLTIIGSDNGLSPGRWQAIIWTNAGILLIGPLETNFNWIFFEIQKFSYKKMNLKMSAKWRPFFLNINALTPSGLMMPYDKCIICIHYNWYYNENFDLNVKYTRKIWA